MDAKSIFIVVIVLILLYYIVSTFLTSSGLTSMSGAEEQLTVASSKLKSGGTSNSAYSIWFYVDDWSKNYGSEKVVFQRVNASDEGLKVALGSHTNDLIVTVDHSQTETTTQTTSMTVDSSTPGYNDCPPVEDGSDSTYSEHAHCDSNGNEITYYTDSNGIPQPNGKCNSCTEIPDGCVLKSDCTSGGYTNSNTSFDGSSSTTSGGISKHTCTVKNVPIQKWVNVIVSFNNRTLDIYMNGKLVKTCYMENVPQSFASDDVVISPTGKTFSGMTSKFKFWNTSMDPQKAWYTYSDGFAPGLGLASFFNKYKFKMALLENNIETTSVTI
jgi:hypothetical protein